MHPRIGQPPYNYIFTFYDGERRIEQEMDATLPSTAPLDDHPVIRHWASLAMQRIDESGSGVYQIRLHVDLAQHPEMRELATQLKQISSDDLKQIEVLCQSAVDNPEFDRETRDSLREFGKIVYIWQLAKMTEEELFDPKVSGLAFVESSRVKGWLHSKGILNKDLSLLRHYLPQP